MALDNVTAATLEHFEARVSALEGIGGPWNAHLDLGTSCEKTLFWSLQRYSLRPRKSKAQQPLADSPMDHTPSRRGQCWWERE